MSHPIVIAHHLIWTAYGWWLPNDLRGSGSRQVASDVIAHLGELHFGRKRMQPAAREVREFYRQAATLLKHPLMTVSEPDRLAIADAFAEVIVGQKNTCYPCAIMPDHVHILIRKHKHSAEEMIVNLQEARRLRLSTRGLRPENHPVWTGGAGCKVLLDALDDIRRTIPYIELNPAKMGLPRQSYSFVKEYDGWPLHPGHSPESPYPRRLRGEE